MNNTNKNIYAIILLIVIFTLQACTDSNSSSSSIVNQSPSATSETISSYPTNSHSVSDTQESISQAYPGQEQNVEDNNLIEIEEIERPLNIPAPESGYATIGGIMVNEGTNQPPPESLLYLAPLLYTDQGLPIVSLDRQNDPVVVLPPQGLFVFENVEPGEYSLVFFTPDYSFLIEDGSSGNSLILTINPDEIVDLDLIEIPNR